MFGTKLSGTCGPITVTFYKSGTSEIASFVTLDKTTGILTLAPLLGDPTGTVDVQMVIHLTNYPSVKSTQTFSTVIVGTNDCSFDVIAFGKDYADEVYTFSNPVNTKAFNPIILQTVKNCPRTCTFYENLSPLVLPSNFVSSVDPQTGIVTVGSGSTYLDGSVFCLVIVCESTKSLMPQNKRIAYDRFTVKFQIDCSADKIHFVEDFTAIDYYITGEAIKHSVMPIYTHTYSACPVACSVVSPTFSYTMPSFVRDLDTVQGYFDIVNTDEN